MNNEVTVPAKTGIKLRLKNGETLKVIDIEGEQVVDFFASSIEDGNEVLSTGVTIDCNESLKINKNQYLYTNHYNKMFQIVEDTVGSHDLLHPCCRKEMYEHFYKNGENHSNCYENITDKAKEEGLPLLLEVHPFNIFMNTKIKTDGSFEVLAPLSKANDYIVLKALMDVNVFVAACSVSESDCNGGRCKSIKVIVGKSEQKNSSTTAST
ncbi:MAG: urea carboxylase-associated family protein [Sphingobacteriia bacterium]|nr:urea carboxylase-associated family protein [Sphingobacteriia bacterium]